MHVHAARFKKKRNLLYMAVTRAMDKVKISGISSSTDLIGKIELHPKTVLWQHARGQQFSEARVAAAQRDAARA